MDYMKYIITKKYQAPILFSPVFSHNEIAERHVEILSAGFAQITADNRKVDVCCFGESISLNIKSNPEVDAKLIKKMIDPYNYD